MQFNSYNFILFFFPIVCIGYYLFISKKSRKYANVVLLISSVAFMLLAGKESLFLLILSILYNYVIYRGIVRFSKAGKEKVSAGFLIAGIVANIVLLFYFKYYNFFIDLTNYVFKTKLSIKTMIQPMGISFIVFQQIAFLIDAWKGELDDCKPIEYAVFVSYFPHVSSGPIILHRDLLPYLKDKVQLNWDNIAIGIYMFVMGLGKKVLIADTFAHAVDWGYSNTAALNSTSALFVSVAYTIQIYFDFSGYSDMAIGISKILQLDLPMNFNSPYKAKTILEFWDRWHMTLTRFLTRYLYIPLGGSRKGKVRTYINTMVVFLCSGLWHGANLTFVLWGVLHGCFMIFTKHFKNIFDKIPKLINCVITIMFINFTWILFRAGSFEKFREMVSAFAKNEWGELCYELCEPFCPFVFDYIPSINISARIWAVTALLCVGYIIFKCKNVSEKSVNIKYSYKMCIWTCTVAVLCILSFSGISTFIYSNF